MTMDTVETAKVLTIRECGHDEYWLLDRIFDDPTQLGLGDLQAFIKEKRLSQGGRLDLLLKNPEDDSMFEVELQLGATDESHIIRTIEYWDNMKLKWPKRSHTAVLIAEEITNRFFNVVHLLGLTVPIIAIKANIVQIGEMKGLNFTKVIDSYEEPEIEETPQQAYDEKHWIDNYPGTLYCARFYKALLEKMYGEIPTKYFESYISLSVNGTARVWITKRKNDRAFIEVKHAEENFQEAVDYLNKDGISFGTRGGKYITFKNVSEQQLMERSAIHEWLAMRLSPEKPEETG
jgi:hypothetical protein